MTIKRGPGRPPVPKEHRKAIRVVVKMSPIEVATLDRLRGTLNRSAFVRRLLRLFGAGKEA